MNIKSLRQNKWIKLGIFYSIGVSILWLAISFVIFYFKKRYFLAIYYFFDKYSLIYYIYDSVYSILFFPAFWIEIAYRGVIGLNHLVLWIFVRLMIFTLFGIFNGILYQKFFQN